METAIPPETKHNHLDLWEAWIDMQNSGNHHKGILYIIGDVLVENHILRPFLVKKEQNHQTQHELVLEVIPAITSDSGQAVEVFYSENIASTDQYQSILIISGKKIIARITEIDILQ